jgi:basic amino acid/polyamine antiporter, APA family
MTQALSDRPSSDPSGKRPAPAAPHRHLTLFDSTSIIVGIIIGSTIYRSAPLIASQVPNVGWLLGVWVIGGAFSLIGALCYAELATAYPREGGDYVFLTEAFGKPIGFLFAWTQFWIVRPGSIGAVAYIFAEYANQLFPLDARHRPMLIYAVGAVAVLSGVNVLGVRAGKWTQNLLTLVKYLGLLAIVAAGLLSAPQGSPSHEYTGTQLTGGPPAVASREPDVGLALIFVFLAYSGWHEMAYVSAEVRNPQRNLLRALVLGTTAVAGIYIAVNLAFVHALGLGGLQQSGAVATDVLGRLVGPVAGKCIGILICITALGSINGMIFTGSRIFYATGIEHRHLSWLGRWDARSDTPIRPLLIQSAATVALTIGFGWRAKGSDGFQDSIAFTSPAFYFFLCLVGFALLALRTRSSSTEQGYRVPFYPIIPLLFCGASVFMLSKGLDYAMSQTPWGLLASLAVMGAGAVLAWLEQPLGEG